MLQHQIPPRRRLVAAWALPIIAVALISPLPARADAVSDFYKGKDVRMIISSTVGGGYAIYARLIARHLSRPIPGNPKVFPQNMPGPGAIAAANHIFGVAPKDAPVIAA